VKLCPKTLRSVAKELRASAKWRRRLARDDARKYHAYGSAAVWAAEAEALDLFATHFEGQAKAAEKKK
jgi:hypothetical protein